MEKYLLVSREMLKEVVKEAIREELLELFFEKLPYVSEEEQEEIENMFGSPDKESLAPEKEGLDWLGG